MSRVDRRLNRMSVPSAGRGGKAKRAMGVQAALEWAFRIEKAQLELPLPKGVTEEGFGFGLEHILLQRAELGCKVDGGQYKIGGYTHPDAEIIAATVAGIPDSRSSQCDPDQFRSFHYPVRMGEFRFGRQSPPCAALGRLVSVLRLDRGGGIRRMPHSGPAKIKNER